LVELYSCNGFEHLPYLPTTAVEMILSPRMSDLVTQVEVAHERGLGKVKDES
jgi:hypothetical protein